MTTVTELETIKYANDIRVDSLQDDISPWNYLIPYRNVLYYTFDASNGSYIQVESSTSITAFNATQKNAAREIMVYVQGLIGVNFVEVASASQADIHFGATNILSGVNVAGQSSTGYGYSYNGSNVLTAVSAESIIWLDNYEFFAENNAPVAGSDGYQVLLHEIGHALGLGHPFDMPNTLPAVQDNTDNTVMSYTWNDPAKYAFQSYDLMALTWIYGDDGLAGSWGYNSQFGNSLNPVSNDTLAPTVVSFSPVDEATKVAVNTSIVVTFSEAVQRGSGSIVLKTAAGAIVASYDAAASSAISINGNVLTLQPGITLAQGAAYRVDFAAGSVKDLAGNSYGGTTSYNFTTQTNTAPVLNTPTALQFTDTSSNDIYLLEVNGQFSATDADVGTTLTYGLRNGTSSNGSVVQTGTFGSLTLQPATGVYTFFPNNQALQKGKANTSETFTVTVTDGMAVTEGLLTINVVGSNDTPSWVQPLPDLTVSAGSTLSWQIPSATVTDRDANDTLSYTASFASGALFPVWLQFNPSNQTLFGTPPASAVGLLELRITATDGSGASVSDVLAIDVRTSSVDTQAPTVLQWSPTDGATNVAVGSNITLGFSEAVQRGNGNILLKTAAGVEIESFDAASSSRITLSGSTLILDPSADLLPGTSYRLEFAAGSIKDTAGNLFAGSTGYDFTTVAQNPATPSKLDEFVVLQYASAAVLGAGTGNDTYLISGSLLPSGTSLTLTDTQGNNSIQLVVGLSIASSKVASTALQLTLNTGAVINVLDADKFTYDVGGNLTAELDHVDVSFASFAQNTLGVVVPTTGVVSGGPVVIGNGATVVSPLILVGTVLPEVVGSPLG
ncbi:MAG: Ig-like domain-containing protein [Burkholderiaceae bacterium]|nr:Ig-like domain-containing protein [Burkholderiaceae bacterium]